MRAVIVAVVMSLMTYGVSHGGCFDFSFGKTKKRGSSCTDLVPVPVLSPSSVAFGNISTGHTQDEIVTLSNTGTGQLSAASLAVTGTGFSMYSTTCGTNPFDLSAGSNCTATVRFAPETATEFSGSLTMSAPNLDNVVASLSGTGLSNSISCSSGLADAQNNNILGAGSTVAVTSVDTRGGAFQLDNTGYIYSLSVESTGLPGAPPTLVTCRIGPNMDLSSGYYAEASVAFASGVMEIIFQDTSHELLADTTYYWGCMSDSVTGFSQPYSTLNPVPTGVYRYGTLWNMNLTAARDLSYRIKLCQ